MPNVGTYQISDIENELSGMLHGTTLNQITNLQELETRAARRVLDDVDPQETKVVAQFGQIWRGIYDYPLFVDLKGNKIVDIFPQSARNPLNNFTQQYNKEFDLWKNYSLVPDFTPRYSSGTRTIRINGTGMTNCSNAVLNNADGYNTNGLWVTSNNASNVQTTNLYYTDNTSGSVSIQLNQTGVASVGTVTNSTFSAINLTANYNNATNFFYVYLPNASAITSLSYSFGSSAGNYYILSGISTDAMGNAFVNGWNLIKVPWTSMTIVGVPNNTLINYISVSFSYNGVLQTGVLINQFSNQLGVIMNMEYYSKYLFRDAVTGTFQEKVTSVDNYVNLDTDGINLYLLSCAIEACQQQQGLSALFGDMPNFENRYQDALAKYRLKYRSETQKPRSTYYSNPAGGYRRYFGRGYRTP